MTVVEGTTTVDEWRRSQGPSHENIVSASHKLRTTGWHIRYSISLWYDVKREGSRLDQLGAKHERSRDKVKSKERPLSLHTL